MSKLDEKDSNFLSEASYQETFSCGDSRLASLVFGQQNRNLKRIEQAVDVQASSRGEQVVLRGTRSKVQLAHRLLQELESLAASDYLPDPQVVDYALNILRNDPSRRIRDVFLDTVFVATRNRKITPKTLAQKAYVESMRQHELSFGIGPAGTGKTYLAMAMAVSFLMRKEVSRIVLVRPAVEAGERLGFLPGDLAEKVNPYLRPMYDALYDMIGMEQGQQFVERGIIEVAPLAFMRGRTLNNSYVILDEAQNTTGEQMKMFLTRLGFGSRAVVTGDITQIDLPTGRLSGLIEAQTVLKEVEGVGFTLFTQRDVVRHPLVQHIVRAYEARQENLRESSRTQTGEPQDKS